MLVDLDNMKKRIFSTFCLAVFLLCSVPSNGQQANIDSRKPPALLYQRAKKVYERAAKLQAYLHAPVEMKRAGFALTRAASIKGKINSSNNEERAALLTELGRLSLSAYYNVEIALSLTRRIFTDDKIIDVKNKTSQYKAMYLHLVEEKQFLEKLLKRQTDMKTDLASFSEGIHKLRRARADAIDVAEDANLRELDAKRENEKMFTNLQKAKEESLFANRGKEQAQREKRLALDEKSRAIEKMNAALKERENALSLREEALRKFNELNAERMDMKNKLDLLTAKFAKVRQDKRGLIVSLSDILFDIGKADLALGTKDNIKKLADMLRKFPQKRILVEGHTDNTGNPQFNKHLSEERAYAVMTFLISSGVKPVRISAKGLGMEKPIASNKTPEGRQRNRRVDIIIMDKP